MTHSYISRVINYLRYNWIPVILIILSIYDLRIDLYLLLDFFTFSSLFYTVYEHPLAITVLLTIPTFIKSINKDK